jgi:hypothetical protein
VAWIFEGSAATVSWLADEAERIERGRQAELSPELGNDEAEALLEFLASFSEPGDGVPEDLGIVRLSVLPTALGELEIGGRVLLKELEGLSASFYADAASGLLTVRWRGPAHRIETPIEVLDDATRAEQGSARLLYLPPDARRRWNHALTEDPNAALTARILQVFDPHGLFAAGRPAAFGPGGVA